MTHDSGKDAERVRAAMLELRAAVASDAGDARSEASFHAVLHRRAPSRRPWRLDPRKVLLAASIAGLAVLGYRAAMARSEQLELPREVAALSMWRPMTDVLLDTPGRQLLRGGTPFGASILDINLDGALR